MKKITIERRLPFGFKGDWGKVYKRYTATELEGKTEQATILESGNIIVDSGVFKYDKNFYMDLGQDVQFLESTDQTVNTESPHTGLGIETAYVTVKTTDAYFDTKRSAWKCVVSCDDIVKVFGRYWIVQRIGERVIRHAPLPLKAFDIELRSIL